MGYDFIQALENLNNGDMVKRTAWNGNPNFIVIYEPMSGQSGKIIMQDFNNIAWNQWPPQNADIMADDWETVI